MNSYSNDELTEARQAATQMINVAHRIVISAHEYPDGDAVGSCLAMAELLRSMGKDATVLLPRSDVGPARCLEGFGQVINPKDWDFSCPPDLLVALDCADPRRICDPRIASWIGRIPVLNIDHHGKELFGNTNLVIRDYSSTGELVYDLAVASGWTVDRKVAEALWCAILTDTNRFTSPSTMPSTLRAAAALSEMGVRISWLAEQLYQHEPFNAFDLRRRAINSLERWFEGRAATIALTPDDFAATGCKKQDGETFPDIPNSLDGVQLSVYFYPYPVTDRNHTRVSVRSSPGSPVTAKTIAEHFGGGGHEHSAAATPELTVADAKLAVKKFLERFFK